MSAGAKTLGDFRQSEAAQTIESLVLGHKEMILERA